MSMMSDAVSVDSGPESEFEFGDLDPKNEEAKGGPRRRLGSQQRGPRKIQSMVNRNPNIMGKPEDKPPIAINANAEEIKAADASPFDNKQADQIIERVKAMQIQRKQSDGESKPITLNRLSVIKKQIISPMTPNDSADEQAKQTIISQTSPCSSPKVKVMKLKA